MSEYKIGKKMGGTQEDIDAAQSQQNAETLNRFANLFGAGKPEPKRPVLPTTPPEMMPRKAILSETPAPKPFLGAPVDERIKASDLANQLKQLQDLEDVGAFEAPDSEVNVRAAKLRALLGK